MTFQQLQYLLEVERTGSFSLAAKAMFVTQSTISNALTALEKELNCRILFAAPGGLRLLRRESRWLPMPSVFVRTTDC